MPLHIPGYNYCGPGTKDFTKDPINELDKACKEHDESYNQPHYRNDGTRASPYFYYTPGDEVLYQKAKRLRGINNPL